MSNDYDYGPPVEQSGETNSPAETHGDELTDIEGATPHTPPPNTATIEEPGGSPTEESQYEPPPPEPEPEPEPEPDPDPTALGGADARLRGA